MNAFKIALAWIGYYLAYTQQTTILVWLASILVVWQTAQGAARWIFPKAKSKPAQPTQIAAPVVLPDTPYRVIQETCEDGVYYSIRELANGEILQSQPLENWGSVAALRAELQKISAAFEHPSLHI